MEWFKWYHGTVDDKKFTVVARKAGVTRATVLAVWQTVVEHASISQERGSLEGYDFEENAACLEIDCEEVERVYRALEERDVIREGRLKNWEKRQPKTDDPTATERKRAQRERERMRGEIEELKAQLSRFQEECHEVSRHVTKSHDREDKRREDKRREEKPAANNQCQLEPTEVPPADEAGGRAGMTRTELSLRNYVQENREFLHGKFPDVDLGLELEEMVLKYRNEAIGADPGLIAFRWLRKLANDRASPDPSGNGVVSLADQVRAANKRAAREFCGMEAINDGCG